MKQNIIYVGLDVDDTQYHGSALDKNTGEIITFKCRPTLKGLLNQLDRLHGTVNFAPNPSDYRQRKTTPKSG